MFTQSSQSQDNQMPFSMNHGAHELLDVHEVLGAMIGGLNQYVLLRDQIQDPELLSIMDRQYPFMLDEYNLTMEAYKTGHDPKHPTRSYNMQIGNDTNYGIKPGEPKKPITSANEINDDIISSFMLSCHKAGAAGKTAAALECTNPVVRRVLQDSVPNCIEMAYEISLYQNKKGYYQVPQLSQQDMNTMLNMYGQAQQAKNMPN
ncbi:spore coat protein [Solibacillus sp. A46]|uniref:Spore coat protein n=1 Tax=Solibacillus faecavium TaxID=2762221 RepID=A0ABR8XX97_9BACL|nr:spore coat protein [Solibacillus faecavium]MBD8036574.1 spore coat protein [Solibacillus faecavium]